MLIECCSWLVEQRWHPCSECSTHFYFAPFAGDIYFLVSWTGQLHLLWSTYDMLPERYDNFHQDSSLTIVQNGRGMIHDWKWFFMVSFEHWLDLHMQVCAVCYLSKQTARATTEQRNFNKGECNVVFILVLFFCCRRYQFRFACRYLTRSTSVLFQKWTVSS